MCQKPTRISLNWRYPEDVPPSQEYGAELGLELTVIKLIEVMPKNAPMAKAILMKENGINEEKVSKVVAILNRKGFRKEPAEIDI